LDGDTQNSEMALAHTSSDTSKASVFVINKGTQVLQPLYVIDGKILKGSDFNKTVIKPEDINSITVLNGKSATDKYGTAGANGVILITTKAGQGKQ